MEVKWEPGMDHRTPRGEVPVCERCGMELPEVYDRKKATLQEVLKSGSEDWRGYPRDRSATVWSARLCAGCAEGLTEVVGAYMNEVGEAR